MRTADVVVFAFSLKSEDSFEEVKEMVSQVRETRPNVPAVLAGPKADLNIELDLSDRVSNWAHQRNVHYIETSARSQVNINELLFMCVSAVRNYRSGINTPPSCTHIHRLTAASLDRMMLTTRCCGIVGIRKSLVPPKPMCAVSPAATLETRDPSVQYLMMLNRNLFTDMAFTSSKSPSATEIPVHAAVIYMRIPALREDIERLLAASRAAPGVTTISLGGATSTSSSTSTSTSTSTTTTTTSSSTSESSPSVTTSAPDGSDAAASSSSSSSSSTAATATASQLPRLEVPYELDAVRVTIAFAYAGSVPVSVRPSGLALADLTRISAAWKLPKLAGIAARLSKGEKCQYTGSLEETFKEAASAIVPSIERNLSLCDLFIVGETASGEAWRVGACRVVIAAVSDDLQQVRSSEREREREREQAS